MSLESRLSKQAQNRLADRIAFLVYGSITVLAAVGGLRLESESLKGLQAAAVLIVVAVAASLSHSMWRVVRARARQDVDPEQRELHELLRSWPILASGLPGTAALVLAAAGAWSVGTGLRLAQALGVTVLFGAGLLTALLAGATGGRRFIYVIGLPSVGVGIVLLEVAAHHV